MKNVSLGAQYRDNVTGFVGRATAECEYINRSTTDVKLEGLKGDETVVDWWFDSSRLTSV